MKQNRATMNSKTNGNRILTAALRAMAKFHAVVPRNQTAYSIASQNVVLEMRTERTVPSSWISTVEIACRVQNC